MATQVHTTQKMDPDGQVPECLSEIPSSEPAAGGLDSSRRWLVDDSDSGVARPFMNGYMEMHSMRVDRVSLPQMSLDIIQIM